MKYIRLSCLFILLINIPLAMYYKKSFSSVDYETMISNSYYFNDNSDISFYCEDESIEGLDDLINQCDLFLKVHISDQTKIKYNSIIFNAEVLETYKGKLNTKTINIHENITGINGMYHEDIQEDYPLCLLYSDYAIPVNENEDYYVFLKKVEYQDEMYGFISPQYGHFKAKDSIQSIDYEGDMIHTLKSLEDIDCFSQYAKKYRQIKEEIEDYTK